MFEIEAKGNAKNSHCFVDNIQLKDELKFEYPTEEQIKTETVCSDVQLRSEDLTIDYDFGLEQANLKTEMVLFETKMESNDYFLKEEEIAVGDVEDAVDSTEVDEYSEIKSDTPSLCNNNQEIGQQKINEYPSLSEHEVPIEISNDSKIGSSFFSKSSPKMEQNLRSLTKISVGPLMASRNSGYQQLIKINNGFKCGLCPFQNDLEAQIKEHFENSHYPHEFTKQLGLGLLKCLYCDYITNHKKNLKIHLKKHSNEFLLCQYGHCDYKTKSTKFLKRHLIKHSSENVFYRCEHCNYKTKHRRYLTRHLILHSDENIFHNCEHCDFKTKHKNSLKAHLMLHSDENIFHKCEHCDFKTVHKINLKRHLILHSDENVFLKCEHCDYKTKHKNSLKTHLILHSDENIFHKCEHCDFKTVYKINLKRHLILHSDENIFHKCEHCDFKTIHEISLKRHLILHSNENIFYKCEHCDFKTKYKTTLKKHLMVHSSQ